MLATIIGFFVNGGFTTLTNIYAKYKDSANESERMQADWAKAQLDAMAANRASTSGFWEMRVMTFFIALPFVIHVNLVGLDTNFKTGLGIYSFPAPFDQWEGSILLSFFGLTAGVIGIKAIAGALRR